MVTDEFSFPIVVTDNHNVTVWPSLWRISSRVDHSSRHQCGNNNYIHDRKWFRKSFSSNTELEKEMKRESACTSSVGNNNYIHDRKWFRKSFCSSTELEKEMKRDSACTSRVEEEIKMDMLWEECFFNDCHVESYSSSPVSGGRSEAAANHEGDYHKVELWNCAEALKTSETGMGMLSSSKKPRIVGVLKVLKKLFILHKRTKLKK